MAIAITIVITLLIVVVISAFFLIRPRKRLNYGRIIDNEYRPDDIEQDSSPIERPRAQRTKSFNGNTSLTPLVIGVIRAVIGLVAVGVIAYIYNSTQNAVSGVTIDAQITRIYAGGVFKAVIAIGVAAALYIFTKFHR